MSDQKPREAECPVCEGTGLEDYMIPEHDPANGPCETCGGTGRLPILVLPPFVQAP